MTATRVRKPGNVAWLLLLPLMLSGCAGSRHQRLCALRDAGHSGD